VKAFPFQFCSALTFILAGMFHLLAATAAEVATAVAAAVAMAIVVVVATATAAEVEVATEIVVAGVVAMATEEAAAAGTATVEVEAAAAAGTATVEAGVAAADRTDTNHRREGEVVAIGTSLRERGKHTLFHRHNMSVQLLPDVKIMGGKSRLSGSGAV
jgi:long-subunit acyl-CoA synthetase (AMP-forming)